MGTVRIRHDIPLLSVWGDGRAPRNPAGSATGVAKKVKTLPRNFALIAATLSVFLAPSGLAAQAPTFRADSVQADGIWFHYRIGGDGPPLLLLHGFTGTGVWWEPYLKRFAEHYTTIVPDLPGHGRSGGGPDPYRFDEVGTDLYAFMDRLDIDRFRAIGYSGGGIVLLHMASQVPDRMESMAVLSATHAPSRADILAFSSFEDHPERARSYWMDVHPGGEAQVRQLIEAFHGLGEYVEEITVTPRELSTIETRTLVVVGDRDPLISVEHALEMFEAIPTAALWVIPMKGHSAMWPDWSGSAEAASILPAVVTRFLDTSSLDAESGG